jgi:hypothetical protein
MFLAAILLLLLQGIAYSHQTIQAVTWDDPDGKYIRLYYSEDGNIKEKAKDPDSNWQDGEFSRKGNTVGAIAYYYEGEIQIRVYVGFESKVHEYIYKEGTWKKGAFKVAAEAADAYYWFDNKGFLRIRAYALKENGDIYQYTYNESKVSDKNTGWSKGKKVSEKLQDDE